MNFNRRRGMMRPNYKPSFQPSYSFDTYDPYQYQDAFERLKPAPDDQVLQDALLRRVELLTPPAGHQASLLSLVTKVQQVFDNLIINPRDFFAAQVDEVRQVGSHRKGTALVGDNHAPIVVVLKTLPTPEAVTCLSLKVKTELQKANPRDSFTVLMNLEGFDIFSASTHTTRVLIATIVPNLPLLDPAIHLDAWMMEKHLVSMVHCKWFEENASHLNVKVLVRLLTDLKERFDGLKPLTPWIIDVFAHYCVVGGSQGQVLAINVAFRRALALLAAGIFTAGSRGITDPCEMAANYSMHCLLSSEEQDLVCLTAQTLLRVLSHGGLEYVLGFKKNIDIVSNICVLGGIVITPSERAYEEPAVGAVAIKAMEE